MSNIGRKLVDGLRQFAQDLKAGDLSKYRRTEVQIDSVGNLTKTVYDPNKEDSMTKTSSRSKPVQPAIVIPTVEEGPVQNLADLHDDVLKIELVDLIRNVAYKKWEQAGRPEGDGVDFWVDAEKETLQWAKQPRR